MFSILMETVFYIRSSLYELSTNAAFSSFRTLHTQHIQRFLSWERFSRLIIFLRWERSLYIQHFLIQGQYAMYYITSYYYVILKQSTMCSIPLFSERGALCILCSSLPRTVCHVQHFFKHFLFIINYYAALRSIPLFWSTTLHKESS
jgi:hypothetical protein